MQIYYIQREEHTFRNFNYKYFEDQHQKVFWFIVSQQVANYYFQTNTIFVFKRINMVVAVY